MNKNIETLLDSEAVRDALESINPFQGWTFDDEEVEFVKKLLSSDNMVAFEKALKIICENPVHCSPLLPLIVSLSENHFKKGDLSLALIDVLMNRETVWNQSFSELVVDAMCRGTPHVRAKAIYMVRNRFAEIFPILFEEFAKEGFINFENSKLALEKLYFETRDDSIELSLLSSDFKSAYTYIFEQKRMIRALYLITLLVRDGLAEARKKISDEDSLVFDELSYFLAASRHPNFVG